MQQSAIQRTSTNAYDSGEVPTSSCFNFEEESGDARLVANMHIIKSKRQPALKDPRRPSDQLIQSRRVMMRPHLVGKRRIGGRLELLLVLSNESRVNLDLGRSKCRRGDEVERLVSEVVLILTCAIVPSHHHTSTHPTNFLASHRKGFSKLYCILLALGLS